MSAIVTRPADPGGAAVLVHLAPDPLVDAEREWQRLAGLEECLTQAVASASVGQVEGLYLVGEEWVVCAHGPSFDPLWDAMLEVLTHWSLPANSYALHRHAAEGTLEQRVSIGGDADVERGPVRQPVSST